MAVRTYALLLACAATPSLASTATGIAGTTRGACKIVNEHDWYTPGNNLKTINDVPSAAACQELCHADTECSTFTWGHPDAVTGAANVCWLKKHSMKVSLTPNSHVDSGACDQDAIDSIEATPPPTPPPTPAATAAAVVAAKEEAAPTAPPVVPAITANAERGTAIAAECNDLCCDATKDNNAECTENVDWAMKSGMKKNASYYPPGTKSRADFQCALFLKGEIKGRNAPGPQWNCTLPPCAALTDDAAASDVGGTPAQRGTQRCSAAGTGSGSGSAVAASAERSQTEAVDLGTPAKESTGGSTFPWWGWLLVILGVCALCGLLGWLFMSGGKKGPKKEKKKRVAKTTAPEQQPLAAPEAARSMAPAPMTYEVAPPIYTAAPVATMMAPLPVYETRAMAPMAYETAPPIYTAAAPAVYTQAAPMTYAVEAAPAIYAAAAPTYAAPVATYVAPAAATSVASYAAAGSVSYAAASVAVSGNCANCGNVFMEDSVFCRKCGHPRQ